MYGSEGASGYVIPRYRAPGDAPWYHVLHGNIPGHQIDFMYCPEVPQGPLTTTHFSHLARLMKYIEPATGATHAFAIGNLSRDDTQHEPGHGAVGLIFGFRIGGTVDHAGRGNPPFAHGLVAVDRDLGYATLLEASATFYRHVMNATEVNSSAGMFYREYVAAVREAPERVAHVLERYVEEYGDLPYLRRSSATWDWKVDDGVAPKRVVIVHKHDEPFGAIAHAAARIAAVLYRSNIKWTSISSGREADIPGGVSVRFVRERDLTMEDHRHGVLLRIEDVSEDEGEIARGMFGARPQGEEEDKPQFGGWRERFAAQQGGTGPLGAPAHAAGGGMPGGALHERERRAAGSAPPSQRAVGLRWNDAHAPGRLAEAGGSGAGLGVTGGASGPASVSAAQQVGPKGTLVIDTEKLLGGAARSAALSAAVEAGHTGPVRMGQAGLGNAAAGQPAGGAAGVAASGAWSAPAAGAPLPPLPGGGGGEERDEIPVIVEKPAASRKWLWAVAGLGVAAAAGAVAVLLSQRVPGVGPAVPDATGAGVTPPPSESAAPPAPSAEASAAATGAAATGAPSATSLPSPWAPPAETAKPQAGQEQPQQDEPPPKTQQSGRTRNTKAGGAATGRFEPKPRGGKVPASSTAEPPLPEGKPDF
ncbi:hypothetical protein [Sorangium sp. So ce233]|uniref:hypothetical protein n=1 Tax=Sorangium sp. So ce233 TaxID=3133290 RepID=UPI003F63B3AF